MKKGVTIKDIGAKLNMSFSTVSKALNDDPTISQPTKDRVKKLAIEWDYIPNEAARNFKQNKTFTLGLIIPDLMDQFFVLAIDGIQEIADKEDYHLIISQSNENLYLEKKIVSLMRRSRVDGVIVAITKNTQDMTMFKNIQDMGIPVVFISRQPNDHSFNYVTVDNEDGAFNAVEMLIQNNYTRIAHIMAPPSMAVSQIRLEGYKNALWKYHIPYDPNLVCVSDFTPKSTYEAMEHFMSLREPPTAIFVFKNYISLDAIEYLKQYHPDKLDLIKIVGFGHLPMFQYLDHKPMASIDENSYQIGYEAAKLLLAQIKAKESGENNQASHISIPCKLILH